jgi:hypothetical protein
MLAAARAAMQRATVLAFDNGFVLAAFILLLATPLALLLEPGVARRRR